MTDNDKNNPIIPGEEPSEHSTVFSSPGVQNKKPNRSKFFKGMVASIVCVVIAVIAVLVALYVLPDSDSGTTSSENTSSASISLLDINVSDMVSFDIKNDKASYTAVQVFEETSSQAASSADKSDSVWQVVGYEKYNMPTLKFFAESIASLSAAKSYTKELSDSEYGLDKPSCIIQLAMADKSNTTIKVGSISPDKLGYYVQLSGDDHIYVVTDLDFTNYMLRDYSSFISGVTIAPTSADANTTDSGYYNENGGIAKIDYLKLGGTCRKDELVIETPSDELASLDYVVTSPVYRVCEYEKVNTMLTFASTGLMNSGAYVLGYTDQDLKQYGLDHPYSTFDCKIGSYSFTASFGEVDEEGYYPCIVNDSDIIYKIDASNYTFITNDGDDVYLESLFCEFIATVDNLNIATADDSIDFKLDRSANTANESDSVFKVFANGKTEIDKLQFGYLYERLIQFTAEEYTDITPAGDAYITVTVNYLSNKSKAKDVIKLYPHSDRRYVFVLNDTPIGLVAKNNVDDFYECAYKLLAGIEISRP